MKVHQGQIKVLKWSNECSQNKDRFFVVQFYLTTDALLVYPKKSNHLNPRPYFHSFVFAMLSSWLLGKGRPYLP